MAIDATVAGAAANSYLTVADADALARNDLGPDATAWLAGPLDSKERALVRATRECDAYARVAGTRFDAAQALLFPRSLDVTSAGVAFLVPNIKLACYEQATYVLANAKVLDEASTRRAQGLIQFTDDDVSGSPAVDPAYGRMSPDAIAYLEAIGTTNKPVLRTVAMARPYL